MDYFHFWLPAINGGILAIFPLALIALTKRNHMVSCVILGVIVTEYDTVSVNILFIIILAYAVLLQDTMFFIEVTIASFKYNFLK